ncbi:hypothetical protein JOC33_000100 [Thalassobacillus pellis]|nr:hypothetical protein [Thalassobacillus pellis]
MRKVAATAHTGHKCLSKKDNRKEGCSSKDLGAAFLFLEVLRILFLNFLEVAALFLGKTGRVTKRLLLICRRICLHDV